MTFRVLASKITRSGPRSVETKTCFPSGVNFSRLAAGTLASRVCSTARRSRYIIMRLLYASLLLAILSMMYLNLHLEMQRRLDRLDTAVLAQTFFITFMLVQLAIVMLLTPAYVAGAIAEEKDRKTLEFMLATDLRNREIVLSKLLSRLANMTLLLLTGLPILSMLQFIGGVDPQPLLAFIDTINAWLARRLERGKSELSRVNRLAEAFERVNQATRDAVEYNLERKPLVFNVFGLLAEATRG